jgi:tRNA-specific 2-thiouridylase
MSKKSKGKVFVGMSGGVDSSVSAALLQKEGYEVIGVFMKVWQPDFLPCTWREERLDAIRVAAHLDIPLLTWDFEKEYKEAVFDYMIREYKQGRTPNPDVMCNKEVKFGAFFRRAMAEGADYVATGHYAQVSRDKESGMYRMLAGLDESKDQSYFLWNIGQGELSKTFFPVGGFKKTKVRELAKKFKLPVAEKKDSQGLCFVGKLDMKEFLAHFMEEKEGSVLDESGKVIGIHRGAYFYTIGERRGFTITQKTAEDTPYYIIAKDLPENTITVAHKIKKVLDGARTEIRATDANFCRNVPLGSKHDYEARVRYHGEATLCTIESLEGKELVIHFKKPVVVDAGQSIVFYHKGECLGGAVAQ